MSLYDNLLSALSRLFSPPKTRRRPLHGRRAYEAAKTDRLTDGWTTVTTTADTEIYRALQIVRARSRDLAENNDYAKRFFNLLKANVVGPSGIKLQAKSIDANGQLDQRANEMIEAGWIEYNKKENFTVTGGLSGIDGQKLFIESIARDGEILARKIQGWKDNKFRFALQFIEADHLDETLNKPLPGGNKIIMGREFDKWKRCVAYWLKTVHPGNILPGGPLINQNHERIPADQIIYGGIIERAGQSRSMPWLASPLKRMKMLNGYEEAELVAARVSASKMGFFTSKDSEGYVGEDTEDDYSPVSEADPGTFEQLPTGMEFQSWTPDHPNTGFKDFEKAILRGIASGLNVSYVALANDLEGVSYSSIRSGELNDRDQWRTLQTWMVEHFMADVFNAWLTMALTSQAILLPLAKIDKFLRVIWQARGWQWVDPVKEVNANVTAVQAGFKSLQDVASEQGRDIEDIMAEIEREKKLAEQHGLTLSALSPSQTTNFTFTEGKDDAKQDN